MNPTHVMGRRVVAFIIDYVLLVAAFAGLFYVLATHTDQAVHLTGWSHVTFGKDTYYLQGDDETTFYVIELAIALLYAGVIQGLTGATIGKLICGIRVMREDGSRPGIGRGVLRWVLLIVDDFPYFIPMLTGFIVAMTNDRRRRVGDMAAGTFVVRAGVAGVPVNGVSNSVATPPQGTWPPAPDPAFRQSAAGATTPRQANRPAPGAPAPTAPAPTAPVPATAPPTRQTPAAAPASPPPAAPDEPTAPQRHAAPEPPKPAPEPEPAAPPSAPEPATQPAAREPAAQPAAREPAAQPAAREPAAQPAAPEPSVPGPTPSASPAPEPALAPPPPVAPPMPPANWYPDPSGHARLRYWDGARWTDHTAQ